MDQQMANVFLRMSVLMDRGLLHSEAVEAGRLAGAEFSESFKENIKSLAVGFIGFETAKEGLKEVIEGSAELAEATDRAKLAAENAGIEWGNVSYQMKAAEQAGVAMGFTVQSVAEVYGTLITRTQDAGKATQQLQLSEDVARFKHISLAEAADKVNRAYLGQSRALVDLGVKVAAGASATERQAAIQEYANRVHGQAEEYTKSLAGRVDQLRAKWGEEAAVLGGHVTPALAGTVKLLTDHSSTVLNTTVAMGGMLVASKALGLVQPALAAGVDKFKSVRDGLNGTTAKAIQAEKDEAAGLAAGNLRRTEAALTLQRQDLAEAKKAETQAASAAQTVKSAEAEAALRAARAQSVIAAEDVAVAERAVAAAREESAAATAAAASTSRLGGAVGMLRGGLGAATAAFIGMQLIMAPFQHSVALSEQGLDKLAEKLGDLSSTTLDTDATLSHFGTDIQYFGGGISGGALTWVANVSQGFTALGGVLDDSSEHAKERMGDINKAIASMATSGDPQKMEQARQAWTRLAQEAAASGRDIKDMAKAMPDAAAAIDTLDQRQQDLAEHTNETAEAAHRLGLSQQDLNEILLAGSSYEDITKSTIAYQAAIGALTDRQQQLKDAVASSSQALSDANDRVTGAKDAYQTALRTEATDAENVTRAQADLNKARVDAAKNVEDLKAKTESLTAAEGDAADKLEHARRAAAAAARLDPHSLKYSEIMHQLADAQSSYDDSTRNRKDNESALADAMRKGVDGSDQVVSASRALREARQQQTRDEQAAARAKRDIGKANDEAAKAEQAYQKAVGATRAGLDLATQAGRDNATAMLGVKDTYDKLHPASQTEYSDLQGIYEQFGLTDTQIQQFLKDVNVVPDAVAQATAKAKAAADAAADSIGVKVDRSSAPPAGLPGGGFWLKQSGYPDEYHYKDRTGRWQTWSSSNPNNITVAPHPMPTHAWGGDLDEGLNLVGEQGPEWVDKTGSRVQVFRTGDAPTATAAAGGGVHLHLNNVTVNHPVDVEMIIQRLQFAARRWS